MKRKPWALAVVVGLSICNCGCRSTHLETYAPNNNGPYDASQKILGLPPMAGGIQISASSRQQWESELDKALAERWGTRYVPLSQGQQSCKDVLERWTRQMDCDYDLAARLRVNSSLCHDLAQASGCRYAIMPIVGRCNSDALSIMNITYVIGNTAGIIPVPLGRYNAADMSFSSMTLLDLKEAKVISETAMASREKPSDASIMYPGALLNAVVRSETILQRKK